MRSVRRFTLMAVILICVELAAEFLLVPVTYQYSFERQLEALEQQDCYPDMVFLGDSMTIHSIVPSVIDENLDGEVCSINAGTSWQKVWGSYYYLKDLMQQYDFQYVILGVGYWGYVKEGRSVRRELLVMDRIRDFGIKMEYCTSIFEPEEYPYLLKSYANRDEITGIRQTVKRKLTAEYLLKQVELVPKEQMERGHVSFGAGQGEAGIGIERLGDFNESLDPLAEEYLSKIYELCEQKNAKLYLIGMPVESTQVYASESYQDYYDFFQRFAEVHDVSFWDLNLLTDRDSVIPDALMGDTDHVGSPGDQQVSRKVGELLNQDLHGISVASEFYPSVEAWRATKKGILACDLSTEAIGYTKARTIKAESIQEEGLTTEFEFWISTQGEDGPWEKLQDYGVGSECDVPAEYFEQKVWMKVNCRRTGSQEAYERCRIRSREPNTGD